MASVYPRQQNTPLVKKRHRRKVRVTDPRHALFGRNFQLLDVRRNGRGAECCTVRLENGLERSIPIEVTDLARRKAAPYPLPLDVPAVEKLLAVFQQIIRRSGKRDKG